MKDGQGQNGVREDGTSMASFLPLPLGQAQTSSETTAGVQEPHEQVRQSTLNISV